MKIHKQVLQGSRFFPGFMVSLEDCGCRRKESMIKAQEQRGSIGLEDEEPCPFLVQGLD